MQSLVEASECGAAAGHFEDTRAASVWEAAYNSSICHVLVHGSPKAPNAENVTQHYQREENRKAKEDCEQHGSEHDDPDGLGCEIRLTPA
jgi:hypothetical protein